MWNLFMWILDLDWHCPTPPSGSQPDRGWCAMLVWFVYWLVSSSFAGGSCWTTRREGNVSDILETICGILFWTYSCAVLFRSVQAHPLCCVGVCVQLAYDAPSRTTHVVTFKLVLSGVTMEGIIKNLKCVWCFWIMSLTIVIISPLTTIFWHLVLCYFVCLQKVVNQSCA